MSSDQMPHPGEDLVRQIPSLPGSKRRQMPRVYLGGGGMLKLQFDRYIMYQSNRSFNMPPPTGGKPPGIWIFGKCLLKFPPPRAEKLFKCPHPWENYQITFLTFQ